MDPDYMVELKWPILLNKFEKSMWKINNNLAT